MILNVVLSISIVKMKRRLQKEGELPPNFKFNLDDFETVDEEYGFTMDEPSDSSESESEYI